MESLFVLFSSLAIYFLLKDNPPTRKSVMMSGLLLGLASLTRVTGVLLLAAFLLYLLTHKVLPDSKTRIYLSTILVSCVLVLSIPYYGRQLYDFGTVEIVGRILPAREEAVSLDSLLYRVEIGTDIGDSTVQKEDIHYTPWFRLIGTYYEFWGIWGGAVNILFRERVLNLNPFVVLLGFTLPTIFLTYLHILGGLSLGWNQRNKLLHLCVALIFFAFFTVAISSILTYGTVDASMGYRKPLITVAPILAIYGGRGMAKILERIKEHVFIHSSIRFVTVISLGVLLLAVCFQGIYMRERYETRLLKGANWIKENTDREAIILTSRSLEIAYLSRRRTMTLVLVAPRALDESTLLQYKVSHILIPTKEFSQRESLDPYLRRFLDLQQNGTLREVYRDPDVIIFEVVFPVGSM